ncbi:MAG: hypothetical protein ACR2ML_11695, partial [Solirubrobacteraceae bacterium]
TVPRGAVREETEVRIEELPGTATELLPGTETRSRLYAVDIGQPLRKPVELAFRLSRRPGSRDALAAASRERDGEMWVLRRGDYDADRRVLRLRTRELSQWQVLEDVKNKAVDLGVTATSTLLQLGGVRAKEPACGVPPFGYALQGEVGMGDANALVFACLEGLDEEMALRVVNNRAIGMEYEIPEGMQVKDVDSPELAAELMDKVREVFSDSPWRTVSATGETTLSGRAGEMKVTVEPTVRSFVFDLNVFAIGQVGGKSGKAASATVDFLRCVRGAADRLGDRGPETAQAAMDAAHATWRECGDTLAAAGGGAQAKGGALFFGATKLGTGSTDAVAELFENQQAELRVVQSGPRAGQYKLAFEESGRPAAIGPFDVRAGHATVSDASAAFGATDSKTDDGSGGCDLLWGTLGLKANAADYGSGDACGPETGRISSFVIRSPAFETDRGLRVGMSEAELRQRHPEATTRGPGPAYFDFDPVTSGSLYTIETEQSAIGSTGSVATLAALVDDNGRVTALEVSPYLAGD